MYKEINELDRMTIGVREWAVETILTKGIEADRWYQSDKIPNTEVVCKLATKLEEYVVGEIGKKPSFQPEFKETRD